MCAGAYRTLAISIHYVLAHELPLNFVENSCSFSIVQNSKSICPVRAPGGNAPDSFVDFGTTLIVCLFVCLLNFLTFFHNFVLTLLSFLIAYFLVYLLGRLFSIGLIKWVSNVHTNARTSVHAANRPPAVRITVDDRQQTPVSKTILAH